MRARIRALTAGSQYFTPFFGRVAVSRFQDAGSGKRREKINAYGDILLCNVLSGERYTTSEMDEYDKKFAEMQKYIPFLEAMIERLQNVKDKSREVQLQKMQSLHGILSNSKRKLKIETLQRCEDVLQKLHNRVEKVDISIAITNFHYMVH